MSFRHPFFSSFGRHFFSSLFQTGLAPGRRPDEARGRILSAPAVFFLLFFFLSVPAEAAPGAPSASAAVSAPAFPAPSASPETPALPERAVSPAPEASSLTDPAASTAADTSFVPDSSASPVPAETPAPAAPPKVIDRITHPGDWADFAFDPEDDLLEIYFPFIRDQDCAVFRYQGQVWMLDCGDERAQEETVPLLKALGISRIDKLINSHPHHDHLNGLYAVDAAAPVQELAVCFPEDATRHMTAAMEYCKGNGIPVTTFGDESVMGMGDGFVTFLHWLKGAETDTVNNRSAVTMVTFGACNILFTADIEYHAQQNLFGAVDPEQLKADILRYPHHGKSRMTDSLFAAISPELTIITNTNRIVELRESTKFLGYLHQPVLYTHRPPYVIRLRTDGERWLVDQFALELPSVPTTEAPAAPAAEPSPDPAAEAGTEPPAETAPDPAPDAQTAAPESGR